MPREVQGFGRCLLHAAQELFATGFGAVCLVNCDSPTLPTALLIQAARVLLAPGERVVLGPADDGGYYLIGMKRPHAHLFADIAWSTGEVAAITRAQAAVLGIELVALPTWYDVDDAATLAELVGGGLGRAAVHGPAALRSVGNQGMHRTHRAGWTPEYRGAVMDLAWQCWRRSAPHWSLWSSQVWRALAARRRAARSSSSRSPLRSESAAIIAVLDLADRQPDPCRNPPRRTERTMTATAIKDPRRYFEAVDTRKRQATSPPVCVYLEVTNRCNLLCETCPRTFETLEPPADMTWELFTSIVDQVPDVARVGCTV